MSSTDLEQYPYKYKPYAHQLEALKRSWNKKYFAYFMEMGCVDADTEYLSETKGWRKMFQYNIDKPERIAVSDIHGNITYEYPQYFIQSCTDKFIQFKSITGHIDMMLTPEHRCSVLAYKINREYSLVENTAQQLYDRAERNADGIRYNTGFPTSVKTNIFLELNKGSDKKLKELIDMFKATAEGLTTSFIPNLETVDDYQRKELLKEAKTIRPGVYYASNYDYARLIHYFLIGSGERADITTYRKGWAVRHCPSPLINLDSDLHIYGRRFGRKYRPDTITFDKAVPAFCFRTSTEYVLLRRNGHIFITGNSGKTKVTIDNAAMLFDKGAIDSMMVIAPKGCYANWAQKEIPQHMPEHINYRILLWDSSMSKTKRNKFIEAMKETKPTTMDIFVVNLESLVASKDAETAAKEFFKYHTKPMGIIDESTCIKTPRSKGTRKILAMSPKFNVRRIITGSPITNSPFDMFAQSQFLEKNCLGFQTYNRFKEYYAVFKPIRLANGRTINVPERFVNLDDLAKRLEPMSYRVLKKDCLDLPPKIYETRSVDLTPIQRKIYNDILANKFTEFEGKEMTADIVLTTLLRQHQIICGSYTADDGTIIRIPECPRIYQLMDLLEETSGKVIIFANYVDNIKQICEHIETKYGKESYVHYYGDTTTAERTDAIRLFEDPLSPVRFFVGNTQTAGRGITLVQAETVIYYSNNYSLESRQQSEDRAHRPGQTKSVTYVDMLCRDTIDEKIIKALMSKQSISQQILQDDPKEWFKL